MNQEQLLQSATEFGSELAKREELFREVEEQIDAADELHEKFDELRKLAKDEGSHDGSPAVIVLGRGVETEAGVGVVKARVEALFETKNHTSANTMSVIWSDRERLGGVDFSYAYGNSVKGSLVSFFFVPESNTHNSFEIGSGEVYGAGSVKTSIFKPWPQPSLKQESHKLDRIAIELALRCEDMAVTSQDTLRYLINAACDPVLNPDIAEKVAPHYGMVIA